MAKKILIYSTPECMFCNAEKDWLKEKGFKYNDIDVNANPEKGQEMVRKSGQMGVPVTVIDDGGKETLIVGFDKAKLKKALGIK